MATIPTFPLWQMHEVKDWKRLYVANDDGVEELNLVTSVLINYTMAIGVNEIAENNVDDVSCRGALLEAVVGTMLLKGKKKISITRDDVARHIGLRTESAKVELSEFWARMRDLNRQKHTAGLQEANDYATALFSMYQLATP